MNLAESLFTGTHFLRGTRFLTAFCSRSLLIPCKRKTIKCCFCIFVLLNGAVFPMDDEIVA